MNLRDIKVKLKVDIELLSDYNDILTVAIYANNRLVTIMAGNADDVFSRLKRLKR